MNIASKVRFLGRLDEEQVIAALHEADVVVNVSEMEGLPNAVLEAMSCGLPTVLSDIGPHRELIGGNQAGLLCDGSDPHNIAEALRRLRDLPELRAELGRAARRIVEEKFTWDQVTRRLIAIFPCGRPDRA